jgi:hypothetical protein
MQTTNVKIKFETFNDLNFLIDIAGNDASVLHGLTLLQEELPAEISFHVPESYHKRIIGVGGRSIQRIMKKYGVYVKFSNAEEFAAMGGYNDNEDNVVARTPSKNAMNLDNLKQSVMELVNPKVRVLFAHCAGICKVLIPLFQRRIKTTLMRPFPFLANTIARFLERRVFLFTISRQKQTPSSVFRIRRPPLTWSRSLAPRAKCR